MVKKISWKKIGIIAFIISIIFCIVGIGHLCAYNRMLEDFSYRNKYVGGDAYNFIINASRATAYFVLASFFCLIAFGSGVFYFLGNIELSISRGRQVMSISGENQFNKEEHIVLKKTQDSLQKSENKSENNLPDGICVVYGRHLIRRDGKYYCPKCNSLTTELYSSCSNCGTSFM